MALPFLRPRKIASVLMAKMSEGKVSPAEEPEGDMLLSAAEDLISAIHSKDAAAVASALRAAIQMADQDEGEGE